MTPTGMEKIEEAKQTGVWDKAYGAQKEETVPDDLLEVLKQNKLAFNNFFNFTQSIRNRYIYWINEAKRQETREKRIQTILHKAEHNIKPGF